MNEIQGIGGAMKLYGSLLMLEERYHDFGGCSGSIACGQYAMVYTMGVRRVLIRYTFVYCKALYEIRYRPSV